MIQKIRMHMLGTFRGRLALLYVAVELSILIFAALVIYFFLARQVYQNLDDALLSQSHTLELELEQSHSYYWLTVLDNYARDTRDSVELITANGIIQYTSDKSLVGTGGNQVSFALGQAMSGKEVVFVSTDSLLRKSNMRVLALPIHKSKRVVAVILIGHNTSEIQSFFKLLYTIGGFLGLISIVLSAWAGYMMSKRALRPIEAIKKTAKAVARGDLSQRLSSHAREREIEELENNLNHMFEALEASFKSQKRFTADASHELRMPLTILKGEIEVALRQSRSIEEHENLLKQHLDIVARMQRIVDDLLTLARADAGMLELQQNTLDLSLLLQEVGQQHLILYEQGQLHLEMDIQDDLEVMGDASQLERVIFNLLSNAYKYAPQNSTVWLTAYAKQEHAYITVCDEGIGISEEHQNRLFHRFYRVDDARARKQGSAGLGLAICKHIVEAHHGEIWVESKEGEGASFMVRLPLSSLNPEHHQRLQSMMNRKAP
ncbi:MAG: ATP-binding protein [Mariprofundaceae bacterium]|nr:ATP-binding protein [Mariprofundaceae bacterium]